LHARHNALNKICEESSSAPNANENKKRKKKKREETYIEALNFHDINCCRLLPPDKSLLIIVGAAWESTF
jgi:hypothetical protein